MSWPVHLDCVKSIAIADRAACIYCKLNETKYSHTYSIIIKDIVGASL